MPFAPEVQQLIQHVEGLSNRPVHVMEDADLRVRATVTPARLGVPGHIVRFRPGSPSLDYLVASQLQFLVRTFTCPAADRWDIVSTDAERDVGINAMGLGDFEEPFARMMIGSIITQLRTYSIGSGWMTGSGKTCPACGNSRKPRSARNLQRMRGR